MSARSNVLAPYLEFSRIGFVNILAFRLRYYTGILTYLINVTVYYFIWSAVFRAQSAAAASGAAASASIGGYNLPQMLTYVSVGWIIRSFYWNTIDQEMAYEVIEGKIAMDFIKPVSIQWMWIARAIGESAFRLIMLTAPDRRGGRSAFSGARPGFLEQLRHVPDCGRGQLSADGRDQFHDRNAAPFR